ncbi:MAG: ATP-grasp domain-containing protein [Clostridia bacterium]|nr:ATP-grasp domain-containing protein [Clostridia bacterium]
MEKIYPVLLGGDLNCYNVARAFHEAYGVKSVAFGRYAISATKYSSLIDFTIEPKIDTDEVMLRVLKDYAAKHTDGRLILFGCTDDYAAMIIRHKAELPMYTCPYTDESLVAPLSRKAEFYEICEKHGIPYPATVVLTETVSQNELSEDKLGFPYPIIIKPSSSVDYWKHSFDGMKKVYIAKSPADAEKIIAEIYASGYPEKMILQEFIPGGDASMRVFTAFSDSKGKVRAMCLGHTMVEEHTPKGLGNHAAIVTEDTESFPLTMKLKALLEDLKYTGFSNFDIKYTGSGDDFRVFEINLRQGRSNMYMTAAGLNVAKLATEVYDSEGEDCVFCSKEHFWHHVPKSVAYKFTEDPTLVDKAKALAKAGEETSSLWYTPDIFKNPLRFACVFEQLRRQKKKFEIYYPKK